MSSKQALGKGFGSLLPENFDESVLLNKEERIHKILLQDISSDPNQPRNTFDEGAIDELAGSIKRYGLLQPIVVTKTSIGYTIIAGERRYHAAKKAGLSHIPALVRSLKELEKLEIGLIENMQRVDLTPLEQAASMARLNEQFSVSFQDIAIRLGKAHTTIINTVRLLGLPEFARDALSRGVISEGHARSILALKGNESAGRTLVRHIVSDGWSVRQAEAFVRRIKEDQTGIKTSKIVEAVSKEAKNLQKKFGGEVKISEKKQGGKVEFSFKTNKEFVRFLDRLNRGN